MKWGALCKYAVFERVCAVQSFAPLVPVRIPVIFEMLRFTLTSHAARLRLGWIHVGPGARPTVRRKRGASLCQSNRTDRTMKRGAH
eukprot:1060733-Pyramimonas_sp.AAC.1